MAIVAVVWMMFATVIVFFPSVPGPSANEMNYATVVLGGVLLLALLYYFFPRYGGRHWFQGPVGALRALETDTTKEIDGSFSDKDSTSKGVSSIEKIRDVHDAQDEK